MDICSDVWLRDYGEDDIALNVILKQDLKYLSVIIHTDNTHDSTILLEEDTLPNHTEDKYLIDLDLYTPVYRSDFTLVNYIERVTSVILDRLTRIINKNNTFKSYVIDDIMRDKVKLYATSIILAKPKLKFHNLASK